jgi:hypothetical protein
MEKFSALRKLLRRLNNGLLFVLKPLQIVSNFVFLAVAYFVGVGISALLYRIGPGRKASRPKPTEGTEASPDSLWIKLPPAPRDRSAWLRPF